LKDQGIATDEKLAPYLDRAGNASSVKWRAARARMQYLLSPVPKQTTAQEKDKDKEPEKSSTAKPETEKPPTEKPSTQQNKRESSDAEKDKTQNTSVNANADKNAKLATKEDPKKSDTRQKSKRE
jgi:hypothetical protein